MTISTTPPSSGQFIHIWTFMNVPWCETVLIEKNRTFIYHEPTDNFIPGELDIKSTSLFYSL